MAVLLEIDNSISKITGLTSAPFNRLRDLLSYQLDAQASFFSGKTYNRTRYCIDVRGNFATGHLARVVDFLRKEKIEYTPRTRVHGPITKVNHGYKETIQPYPAQIAAAEFAITNRRAIVSMPTGSGKSLVIALIASKLNVRTLVIVPSLQIKEQLKASLNAIFEDMDNITVENIDSSKLAKVKDYNCLIIDEAHHVAAKTYQKLNKNAWNGIKYRFFLTATPFRNNSEETLLFEGIAGTQVYTLPYAKAVKEGYICPIEAYYIELPKVETDAYTWAQVYSELITNNTQRNLIIAKTLLNLSLSGKSALCLVKEIKHGEILSKLTGIPFANGQDETTRHYIKQFQDSQITTLIGTSGILGEGVDTEPCEYVIIAGLGKAKSAFMQQVGRTLRKYKDKESGKVILIRDASHKFLLRHFKEQCNILKDEYNVTLTKLEF